MRVIPPRNWYRSAMRSLDHAAGVPFFSDVGAIASTVVAVCAAITAVTALVRTVRSSRRKGRAKGLKIGWQAQSGPDSTGALVYNESKGTFQQLVLTVSCGIRGRTARKDIALLKAGDEHVWPSEDVHRSPAAPEVGDAHDTAPHKVQITFRDGKGYWSRDEAQIERVRSLVIWAEKTRAETLARHFGRRSPFRRTYAVSVTVEPFERTEALENAFTSLAATGRPPRGHQIPDVVAGPHDWIGRVVQEELVLEPPFDRDGLARVSPLAVEALSSNDRLYGIPYVFDSVALIRNDALAGRGPMPATVEELVRAGTEALEVNGVADGVPLALQVGAPDANGDAGDPYHMWPLFSSAGGSFFGMRQETEAGGARFDDLPSWRDSFVDAFVQLAGLGANGVLRPDLGRNEALSLFLDGRAPFLVCSSRALASIRTRRLEVTVGGVPRFGSLPAVPMVSVYGFFINRNAPNLPAARDLVTTYLSQPDAGQHLNELQQLVPVQEEAMSVVAEGDPMLRPYVEQCRNGVIMPSWSEMRAAWQLLGRTEYRVLAGDGDPRAVAGAAADAGWELLARAREPGSGIAHPSRRDESPEFL